MVEDFNCLQQVVYSNHGMGLVVPYDRVDVSEVPYMIVMILYKEFIL